MTKLSLAVDGEQNEWLVRLKDYIEDRWVVNISDITYEYDGEKRSFNVMLNTLGDFDRVSGRTAPALRRSKAAVLAYALSVLGVADESALENSTLRFGATFEDGIRAFIYNNFQDKCAEDLREKYFRPEDMTEFVVYLGKVFCIFKNPAAMRNFLGNGRYEQLKTEVVSLLRKLDTFGVITDLEHVVFCRTEDRKREILPNHSDAVSPALVLEAMSEHFRRDAAVYAGRMLGANIIAVEYRFSAKSLTHRFTLIPAYDEDSKKISETRFAQAEETLCGMFREALGGEVGRGEVVCCAVSRDSFETLSKRHIHRCMEQDNVAGQLRKKYMAGYVKGIYLHGLTAVAVFGSKLSEKRFELGGALGSMNETMKSIIQSYDVLNTIDLGRSFVRCMTEEEYNREYKRR